MSRHRKPPSSSIFVRLRGYRTSSSIFERLRASSRLSHVFARIFVIQACSSFASRAVETSSSQATARLAYLRVPSLLLGFAWPAVESSPALVIIRNQGLSRDAISEARHVVCSHACVSTHRHRIQLGVIAIAPNDWDVACTCARSAVIAFASAGV